MFTEDVSKRHPLCLTPQVIMTTNIEVVTQCGLVYRISYLFFAKKSMVESKNRIFACRRTIPGKIPVRFLVRALFQIELSRFYRFFLTF
jgi:hypothetical protein